MYESSELPCLLGFGCESSSRSGDVVDSVEAQESQQTGSYRRQDAGRSSATDLGSILVIGDVSDSMVAVLDVPVLSAEAKQHFGRTDCRVQTRQTYLYLPTRLTMARGFPLEVVGLRSIGPIVDVGDVVAELRTDREPTPLPTSSVPLDGLGVIWALLTPLAAGGIPDAQRLGRSHRWQMS